MPHSLSRCERLGLGLTIILLLVHALVTFRRGAWLEGLMDVAIIAGCIGVSQLLLRMFRASSAHGVVAQAVVLRPEPVSVCRVERSGKAWVLRHLHTGRMMPLEEGDLFSIVDPASVPDHSDGTPDAEDRYAMDRHVQDRNALTTAARLARRATHASRLQRLHAARDATRHICISLSIMLGGAALGVGGHGAGCSLVCGGGGVLMSTRLRAAHRGFMDTDGTDTAREEGSSRMDWARVLPLIGLVGVRTPWLAHWEATRHPEEQRHEEGEGRYGR